jgi:hypothetical protein
MPDPILIVSTMGLAGTAAAVVLWICGWPWRAARPSRVHTGWVLGVGVGFILGCWLLGIWPQWPLRQDQDRLLGLVFPAVVVIELLAGFPSLPRWLIWPLRLMVVVGCAPVLLHASSYLTDLAGPGTREWSTAHAWLILGGLAAALAGVWALLTLLARRAPGLSHPVCLAGTIAGASVTVMLSGYASGGQIGLPLAAALLGASVAALVLPGPSRGSGPIGVAVVGLFSLLVIGHFFGQLTTTNAILLFCAPLLGWLPELPYLHRLPLWARGLARVILVGALVSTVVIHAQMKFVEDFRSPSGSAPKESSIQDYMDFGR